MKDVYWYQCIFSLCFFFLHDKYFSLRKLLFGLLGFIVVLFLSVQTSLGCFLHIFDWLEIFLCSSSPPSTCTLLLLSYQKAWKCNLRKDWKKMFCLVYRRQGGKKGAVIEFFTMWKGLLKRLLCLLEVGQGAVKGGGLCQRDLY